MDNFIKEINEKAKNETNLMIGELIVENKYLSIALQEFKSLSERLAVELEEIRVGEQGGVEEVVNINTEA